MEKQRYLSKYIRDDLDDKMVFIGGARQVGKTTLARDLIAAHFDSFDYFNWDFSIDRKRLINMEFPGENSLLIFDELHKYSDWKNFIKGIYDIYQNKYNIIVTGSARLNIYRKGGDSLQGRYHYYTLHPFSYSEMIERPNLPNPAGELNFEQGGNISDIKLMLQFGGFPEPLLRQNERTLRRWHSEKLERLFREDIRDIENIRDIGKMKLLGDLLPGKAGGALSINAIREDLNLSHRAVSDWLDILEQFYYQFRIYPYSKSVVRSLKKESKIYMYDWSQVENEGARFENMIASHLLKTVNFLQQYEGFNVRLNYLRNVDKKEVDFFVSYNDKPWFAAEVKLSDVNPSPNLKYFADRLKIPWSYQVVLKPGIDKFQNGIRIISAEKFLSGLM